MPSERVQRQIDRFLDEAEAAIAEDDWDLVEQRAKAVLRLDPSNEDASTYLDAVARDAPDITTPAVLDAPLTAPPAKVLPDSFVDGRYQVTDFLGEGGRKQVYLAHDTRLDRDVAFAVIKTEGLDATGRQRIQREAQAMGRLSGHPHIVTIHDVGEEDGQPYIVSEYMAGGDVEALIAAADDHQLDLERAVAIANQVAQALEHAHADGVVHRDIKPGNIWLAEDGTAKLGDFGLAFAASDTRMTTEGTMLGTVAYMPPEQALGNAATPQSDLYSLGCALYEMVAGHPPFVGDDAVAVISQHLNTAPVAPSWNRADCPPGLEHLILGLLEKTATERPESAAEVGTLLAAIDLSARVVSAEHGNPLDRLAAGVFVGRDDELQRLRRAFDNALGGHGELVMLVGEPGIGKTRTTYELETYARMRGALVAWGRNHENSGAPPYTPWVQVGNTVGQAVGVGTDPTALQGLGADFSHLVRLFPVLRQMIPNFVEPDVVSDPDAAQYHVLLVYTQFIAGASQTTPLVLVLDDLHWTDKPTLLLLQHLARQLAGMRVLVVGTFRDTDLVRTHPLSEALATLNREGGFERVVLRGLSRDECAAYIRSSANVEPAPSVLSRIFEETEGNPFFLSEVVNLMAQEGTIDATSLSDITIPDGVREALGRRLDRLSEESNAMLRVAAVVGREFQYETLSLLSPAGDEGTLQLVEEALEARVIEEQDEPGRYRFTHHLMQETLRNELSVTRRIRLQGQIGDALERRFGDRAEAQAARLAQHYLEAATLSPEHASKAVRYSILAGQQAEEVNGWAEAARQYERCLSLIETTGEAFGTDIADLQVTLARCASNAGQGGMAAGALAAALDEYEARGDGQGIARAAMTTRAPRTEEFIDMRQPSAERALAVLGDSDLHMRARMLMQTAMYDDGESTDEAVAEAEALAQEHDFRDVKAWILDRKVHVVWDEGDIEAANALTRQAAAMFMDLGNLGEAIHHLGDVTWTLQQMGRLDEALEASEVELQYARDNYTKYGEYHAFGEQLAIARMRGDRGTWERLQIEIRQPQVSIVRAAEAEAQGDLDEVERLIEGSLGTFLYALPLDHAAVARIAWLRGDTERARKELDAWHELVSTAHVFGGFRDESCALAADVLVAIGDGAMIRTALEVLEGLPQNRVTLYAGSSVDRIRGVLALRLGDLERAEREFRRGEEWTTREGCEVERGLCELGLSEVALARDERDVAAQLVDAATERLRSAGAMGYLERALRLRLELQGLADIDATTSIDLVAASVHKERPNLAAHAAPDGTVTLLFSDIENSTARTAELGDAQWMEVLREHRGVVREQLAAYGGYEVKSMGDGFMLAFGSALDGLRCAIAMQQAFAEHNAKADEALRVRIGLHTGEAIKEADDFFGHHVNLAARVGGAATGDEILVSGLLKALTESAGEFTFDAGREVELKGISGSQRVHAVEWR